MIGSFLTRGLVMVFGYAYPAYECYKTVEKNKPEIEQLRFWCQYWILVAVLTVSERVGDTFVSWVPMYSEAKLAFYIYLWYPKTKGASYVYDSFFKPYVAKHETDIDRNLLELRTRAGDYAVLYWQRSASYGQTRVLEILQFIAAQSTPKPRSQPQQQATKVPAKQKPNKKTPPVSEEPSSPTSSTSFSDEDVEEIPESSASQALKAAQSLSSSSLHRLISAPAPAPAPVPAPAPAPAPGVTSKSSNENDKMEVEKASSSSVNEMEKPQETVIEEAIRETRGGRLRKSRFK